MTLEQLARARAAIEADAARLDESDLCPMPETRAQLYLALARAVAGLHARFEWWEDYETGGCCHCPAWKRTGEDNITHRDDCRAMALDAALAALAVED